MNIFPFLEDLSLNNNRPWFLANKQRYEEARESWLHDVGRLLHYMSEWMPQAGWMTAKEVSHRIYRDIRFSSDKTPYKTYFSASINPRGKMVHHAGFYVQAGLASSDNGLFAGLWQPDAEYLRKMRRAIVNNIEEFREITETPEILANFPGWCGRALKTIPKGWPKDHPEAPLLRLLDYGKFHPCDRAFFEDPEWPEKASDLMRPLMPFVNFINYTLLDEEE